jgi:hypothetical protein
MKYQSPGISGCKIELEGKVVRKSCSPEYAHRLAVQQQKQYDYRNTFAGSGIVVPKVYLAAHGWFTMEYLPYKGYIKFAEENSVFEVKNQLSKLIDYIGGSFEDTQYLTDYEAFDLQPSEIDRPNFPRGYEWLAQFIGAYYKNKQAAIPVGNCHGDLTFANLLFGDGNMAVIDFMDTPISSPILDVIKLRQDAKYHWTSFMSEEKHDRTKIKIIDNWFLSELDKVLEQFNVDMDGYKWLEAMNYLKIFKYANGDRRIHSYLVKIIGEIL